MTNDPEDSLPLAMEGGVVVSDGKGGKKKVMTIEDVTPKYTRDKQLTPLRNSLHKLLDNLSSSSSLPLLDNDTINRMGFADLRDALLAYGNMLDPDHIKRGNKAEAELNSSRNDVRNWNYSYDALYVIPNCGTHRV